MSAAERELRAAEALARDAMRHAGESQRFADVAAVHAERAQRLARIAQVIAVLAIVVNIIALVLSHL